MPRFISWEVPGFHCNCLKRSPTATIGDKNSQQRAQKRSKRPNMKTGTIGFWSTNNSNLVFGWACANFSIHPFLRLVILVHLFISDHPVVYPFSCSFLKRRKIISFISIFTQPYRLCLKNFIFQNLLWFDMIVAK